MLELESLHMTRDIERSVSAARRDSFVVRAPSQSAALGRLVLDCVRWIPWRVRWQLAAFEGPEDSELFTSRRAGWAPRDWDVFDADRRLVALLRGSFVLSAGGEVFGQRRLSAESRPGCVLSPNGERLGSWVESRSGREIHFSAETGANPFLRMAIVVAALLDP
jgi:hypothetical protein